jgi:hypothetical protein
MKSKYVKAGRGANKTYFALSHITSNRGRYVVAVNKIDLIQERIEEFLQSLGAREYLIAQLRNYSSRTGYSVQTILRCNDINTLVIHI